MEADPGRGQVELELLAALDAEEAARRRPLEVPVEEALARGPLAQQVAGHPGPADEPLGHAVRR